MSWVRWKKALPISDRPRFQKLRPLLERSLRQADSFEAATWIAARLGLFRLLAHLETPPQNPAAFYENLGTRLGLQANAIDRIQQLLEPAWSSNLPEFPLLANRYPRYPDLAAPFLDTLLLKKHRRPHGFYITPPPIAVRLAAKLEWRDTPPRLLDSGCGTGTLTLAALRQALQPHSPGSSARRQHLQDLLGGSSFIECDPGLAAITTLQLLFFLLDECVQPLMLERWPVVCRNLLDDETRSGFTHIIANPPYLGEKQARNVIAQAKNSHFGDVYKGKADLSLFFLNHAVEVLVPQGQLAFLTPAYWLTADSAAPLRNELEARMRVLAIEPAPDGVYSAPGVDLILVTLEKRRQPTHSAKKTSGRAWRILENEAQQRCLDHMEATGRPLGSLLDIRAGIQSGADRVTAAHVNAGLVDRPVGRGIFVLSEAEEGELAARCSSSERQRLVPLYKTPACGPYCLDDARAGWLIYLDGQLDIAEFPTLRKHLTPFRRLLIQRRECRLGRMPWWRLHWPRVEAAFKTPHLLVPQRALYPRFALAVKGAFTSVDVYHLFPKPKSPLLPGGWLAYLHSTPVHAWLAKRGKRKGDLLELYRTPVSQLPVPVTFSPETVDRLNSIGADLLRLAQEMAASTRTDMPGLSWPRRLAALGNAGSERLKALEHLQAEADRLIAKAFDLPPSTFDIFTLPKPLHSS